MSTWLDFIPFSDVAYILLLNIFCHIACVLSTFKKRPDTFPNLLIASIDFSKDFFSFLFFFSPLQVHQLYICHLQFEIVYVLICLSKFP